MRKCKKYKNINILVLSVVKKTVYFTDFKMFFNFDKPYLSLKDIENGLSKCNSIKYAAYRTAAKLRIIQKAFFMDKVQLRVISCVFEKHQLQQTENSVQLDQKEVESVLSDIFFGVKKENRISLDVDYVCRLIFSFFKNVFDKYCSNMIQVFSFKVGLTILCEAKPREKYHFLFDQLADHNNCVSRKKLEIMLKKMTRLIEYIGEGLVFGSNLIPGTVQSCFQCTAGGLGLSEDVFMNWLMQDPQLLVWLSTFYRLQISESVSHNAKCGICKMYPLVGLRYRCLRCLSYNMCQTCFFTGKVNKKHKLKHPVQEFCCPMTSQQSTKAFLLTLKNRLYKKEYKLQYLPVLRGDSRDDEPLGQSTRLLDEMEISSKTVVNGSRISLRRFPLKELQNIILELEKNSEKLIPQIDSLCSKAEDSNPNELQIQLRNCLIKHKTQVRNQVHRLKLLRSYLASKKGNDFHASTPMVEEIIPKSKKRNFIGDLTNLSPIALRSSKKKTETNWEKMKWDNNDLGTYVPNTSWEEIQSGNFKKRESVEFSETERELDPSIWLRGKTLQELETSSNEGISWLYENENGVSGEEKLRKENEKTLQELQADLKNILGKLQELTFGEDDETVAESACGQEKEGIDISQMDSLFLDLINGIEKLVGS